MGDGATSHPAPVLFEGWGGGGFVGWWTPPPDFLASTAPCLAPPPRDGPTEQTPVARLECGVCGRHAAERVCPPTVSVGRWGGRCSGTRIQERRGALRGGVSGWVRLRCPASRIRRVTPRGRPPVGVYPARPANGRPPLPRGRGQWVWGRPPTGEPAVEPGEAHHGPCTAACRNAGRRARSFPSRAKLTLIPRLGTAHALRASRVARGRAVRATRVLDGRPRIPRPREGGVTGAGPGVPSRVRRDPLRRRVAAHPCSGLGRATDAQGLREALASRATQTRQTRARHRSRGRQAGARRRARIHSMQRCARLRSGCARQWSVGAAVSGLVDGNRVSGCDRMANQHRYSW